MESYIQKLGKLYPISIPEFMIWSALLWEVMTYAELKKQYESMVSGFDARLPEFDELLDIWGIASHDRILLALSACVAAFGALKVLPLISSVKKGQYQELLCTVLSDKKSSLLNRHQLTVYTDDQEEKTIVLSGRATLKPGKKYRIFLAGQEDDALNAVPDYLRPGRSLLGSEELEEQ